MDETGIVRFLGSLDPRAEEFRPRNPSGSNQLTLYTTTPPPPPPPPPPPQVYYPYGSPYPPISEVQVLPFCDGGGVGGYPGFSSPAAYVSLSPAAAVSIRPAVPPPPASAVATRALLLSSVPREASETMIKKELESFGEVRGVQMEKVCDGMATVHFYDLRHAEVALREIRDQHMQQQTRLRNHYAALFMHNSPSDDRNLAAVSLPMPPPARGLIAGCAVWAQFVIPASNAVPDGHNQGTIVIFNLDSEVTASSLKDIFQAFGSVKELRETPSKKHQKFVEFYDVRDAAKALKEMNGKEIHGKPIVIEFSRPGGHSRKFMNAMAANNNNHSISAAASTISSINSINNFYPRIQKYHPAAPPPPPPYLPRKFSGRSALTGVDHTPPRSFTSSQPQFFTKKSNFGKGIVNGNVNKNTTISNNVASSLGGVEYKMNALNLGGGGAVCDGIEDKGDSNGDNNNPKRLTKKSHSNQPTTVTVPKQQQQQQHQQQPRTRPRKGRQAKKFDSRFLINEDALTESNCRDSRTTVMIKNIPNKYSQKLLLNMLDNHCIHCNEQIADEGHDQPLSSYDFVYLPIDFNNKCNVGYGFVNMTTPQATWRLYKAFHHQHWEVFNSRKICEVTYARVQGLEALKEHFKNSKFPCEMDHYLPVVFSPPRDGRQQTEPLPIVGHQNKHHLVIPIGADDDQHHDDDGREMDGHDRVEEDGNDDEEEEEDDDDGHDVGDESEESSESEQGQLILLMGDSGTGCSSSSLNGGVGVDCCCDLEEDS